LNIPLQGLLHLVSNSYPSMPIFFSVTTGLAANRSRRQVPNSRNHFSYEEENSEIVDDVDWEPPTHRKV